eukprot:m.112858 g.112858  ORF g.112858 m.112858 type:complete len:743 (+) comp15422_c0_seq1:1217-3445(+)
MAVHNMQMLVLVLLPLVHASPRVYWVTNPVLDNEVMMIAGAGLADVSVQVCQDPSNCAATAIPFETVEVWESSVKLRLASVQPGSIVLADSQNSTAIVPINTPDVWWAQAMPPVDQASWQPLLNTSVTVTVPAGTAVRIFGRGLSWDLKGRCRDAKAPLADPSTALQIPHNSRLQAVLASCYEALFPLPQVVVPGVYNNTVLKTGFGSSPPFTLIVTPAEAPWQVQNVNVEKDHNGNITAALAAIVPQPKVNYRVALGAKTYSLITRLTVPNNTALFGQGEGVTTIVFTLPEDIHDGHMIDGLSHWSVSDMSIRVESAAAGQAVINMQHGGVNFTLHHTNITMLQRNVSNAVAIFGSGFEIYDNTLAQLGECLWSPYGPGSDRSNFQYSVTMYMVNATDGHVYNNQGYWNCSWMDLDVSNRVVVENNTIACVKKATLPHGNSISGYQWQQYPSSEFWYYVRNTMSRPANNSKTNWVQRETLTTDGSGAWGTGHMTPTKVLPNGQAEVTVAWLVEANAPKAGTRALVVSGPGMGQHRKILGYDEASKTLTLNAPFDEHVGEGSLVSVVSSFGSKVIAGNTFVWAEVVQWYGNTLRGVHSDNVFQDCNVQPGGGDYAGALQGVGECYHGTGENYYTEFYGNTLVNSDGIILSDDNQNTTEPECAAFMGPWLRWNVVRRNAISGLSQASKSVNASSPSCGAVQLRSPQRVSTDIVIEANGFTCPAPGVLPEHGVVVGNCQHCVHP